MRAGKDAAAVPVCIPGARCRCTGTGVLVLPANSCCCLPSGRKARNVYNNSVYTSCYTGVLRGVLWLPGTRDTVEPRLVADNPCRVCIPQAH